MKFILRFIARLAEITVVLCVFAAVILFWLNNQCTEAIYLKLYLMYDGTIFIAACLTGITMEKLLTLYKNEN